jgi:hypothetical protein
LNGGSDFQKPTGMTPIVGQKNKNFGGILFVLGEIKTQALISPVKKIYSCINYGKYQASRWVVSTGVK